MNAEVVLLTPPNALIVSRIHQDAFLKGFWSEQQFKELLSNPNCFAFGVEVAGDIKGFVTGQIVCDEMEILTLAVQPAAQRQGIGRLLIKHLMEKARVMGVVKSFLEVHEQNHKAIALYESFGFEIYGSRADYYLSTKGIQGSALLMKIELI